MNRRSRWLVIVAFATALAASGACGGGSFTPGAPDGSIDATVDAGSDGAQEAGSPDGCLPAVCGRNQCGPHPDGCRGVLLCGGCEAGQACTEEGVCGCKPKTCSGLNATCGTQEDGCGSLINCGTCGAGMGCAINPDGSASCTCTPTTCMAQLFECGQLPDGCKSMLNCGTCEGGTNCSGAPDGGLGTMCTVSACTKIPQATACAGLDCGSALDGCGGLWMCGGTCTPPATCGGGPMMGVCGCTAKTCAGQGYECGSGPDGCGNTLNCGTCGGIFTCNGSNKCVCTPATCAGLGATCGSPPDGCGGKLSCGACTQPNQTCGGDYTCGAADACTPPSCTPGECGSLVNPCGATVECGCRAGDTCVNNMCVCVPQSTCQSLGYECGSFIDSCGVVQTCGPTPTSQGSCVSLSDAGTVPGDHKGCPACDAAATGLCASFLKGPTPPEPGWSCANAQTPANTWCCN